jgi:hypothetical protein
VSFPGHEPRRIGWAPFCDPVPVEWLTCPCGTRFPRPPGASYRACLGCETRQRLKDAGFASRDPALLALARWNAAARAKAGITGESAA